jgi:hypothetical protein
MSARYSLIVSDEPEKRFTTANKRFVVNLINAANNPFSNTSFISRLSKLPHLNKELKLKKETVQLQSGFLVKCSQFIN